MVRIDLSRYLPISFTYHARGASIRISYWTIFDLDDTLGPPAAGNPREGSRRGEKKRKPEPSGEKLSSSIDRFGREAIVRLELPALFEFMLERVAP